MFPEKERDDVELEPRLYVGEGSGPIKEEVQKV